MQVIGTTEGLTKALEAGRAEGRSVGLVPTMGYLHAGHLSLVERARSDCDLVAVTIFVNPLQFSRDEDLDSYPRDAERDLSALCAEGVEIAFVPSDAEMYPTAPVTRVVVEGVGDSLEGWSRPSHFSGVATVVAKLFAMAGSCRAYFGEKDYQQLVLVRRLAEDLSFPVTVVGCPTVRESDGLAMSSRNARLDPADRAAASVLHRALLAGGDAVEAGAHEPGAVAELMASVVDAEQRARLDYAAVADAADLSTPADLAGLELRLLVAARFGSVRLIDNLPCVAPADR